MKKFKKILAVVLSAGIAFSLAALSACTTTTAESSHRVHIDTDWNGICDTCGKPIDEASIVPEKPEQPQPDDPEPEIGRAHV